VNLIYSGYLVAAIACFMVAVEWLLLATRGSDRRTHLLFAACALAAAVDALFVERRFVRVQSPAELEAILRQELNVKEVVAATDLAAVATLTTKANFRALGPRFDKRAPQAAAGRQQRQCLQEGCLAGTVGTGEDHGLGSGFQSLSAIATEIGQRQLRHRHPLPSAGIIRTRH